MKKINIVEVNESNKIEIIKLYRSLTGIGLAEAKQALENLPLTVELVDESTLYEFYDKLVELGCHVTGDYRYNDYDDDLELLGNVNLLPEKFRPPAELSELSRDEIMMLLSEIKRTGNLLSKLNNELERLSARLNDEREKEKAIRDKTHPLESIIVYTLTFVGVIIGAAFGGVWGFIAGLIIGWILGQVICISNDKKIKAKIYDKADRYVEEKIVPIKNQINEVNENLKKLNATGRIRWAADIVGEEWLNPEDINGLTELIKTGRADSLKEALNLYDGVKHRKRMEDMQRDVKLAAETSTSVNSSMRTAGLACPRCGGTNCTPVVETSTSGKDFSTGKGCCGYVMLGPIGILCGACGKGKQTTSTTYWMCSDCGNKFRK